MFKCEFCEKFFSSKSSLTLHTRTAAFCLNLRGESALNLSCQYCEHKFSRPHSLQIHLKTCRVKPIKVAEETTGELQNLKEKEKTLNQKNLKNVATMSSLKLKCDKLEKTVIEQNQESEKQRKKLEKTILEQHREIEKLKSIVLSLDGLDKIVDERNDEMVKLKKIIAQFEKDEKNYIEKNFELEKQLAFERGRILEASKPKTLNHNYKCSTKNKLASVPTDNIRPFTVETIRANLHNYTYEDFLMGPKGLIKFLKSIIMNTNENGEVERNYVCTDPSRNNYFRLEETKEWDSDRGALYIEIFVDEMHRPTSNYFDQLCSKVIDRTDTFNREYNAHLVEELKPFYQGVLRPISKERDVLLTTIKTGIKSSASL